MIQTFSTITAPRTDEEFALATYHRQFLLMMCLATAFVASVIYDTLTIIPFPGPRSLVAAVVVAHLVATLLLQRFPISILQLVVVANWPLHLFSVLFFASVFVVHGGANAGQLVAYTLVAYATYLLIPVLLLLDDWLFDSFVRLVGITSAILAIPSLLGAAGVQDLGPIRLSIKPSYSEFSGIIASGGIFEHAEGHALQMAVGLLCCLYAFRRQWRLTDGLCGLLSLAGLIVSQGRGAIFGVMIAVVFMGLPELFRTSRLIFLGTLVFFWMFPFVIWPQLAKVPGVANYLRLERGLSGRDVAWEFASQLVKERPIRGHGFLASGELTERHQKVLRRSGYSGAGTTFHNTFITKAVELGVIIAAAYSLLCIVPMLRICNLTRYRRQQQLVRSILLLTLTASLFRDYNIGGVRSTSIMVAVFLGLANLWPWVDRLGRAESRVADLDVASAQV